MTSCLRLLSLLAAMVAGGHAMAAVQVDPAFGYRIGDSVVAIGSLAVDAEAQLDAESLPKVGRINGWLSLEEVRVSPRPNGWQVDRVFQVTASAAEPRMLFLPKAELKFSLRGRDFTGQLESVPISVSPLTANEPILRTGFGALRPDRDVPDPQVAHAWDRARLLGATLAALALLWAGVRSLAMRRRGFAPFAVAARRLRRLARVQAGKRDDPEATRGAYRIMHEAFNDAAGQAVFASHKDRFLAANPRFADESAAVRAFFQRSEEAFFAVSSPGREDGGRAQDNELAWLADIARRLARLEQPGR